MSFSFYSVDLINYILTVESASHSCYKSYMVKTYSFLHLEWFSYKQYMVGYYIFKSK